MCDCDKREDNYAEASVPLSDLKHHDFPGADPYATVLSMARLRARKNFEEKYGREPVWSRTVLSVQNSEFRVSVSIREGLPTETYMSDVTFTPPSRGTGNGRTRDLQSVGERDRRSDRQVEPGTKNTNRSVSSSGTTRAEDRRHRRQATR